MKLDTLIKKIETTGYIFSLDKDFDGSCPCFWVDLSVDGIKVSIHGHCWRSGMNWGDTGRESACGIHIESKLPKKQLKQIAKVLKKRLDDHDWYGKWHVKYEK